MSIKIIKNHSRGRTYYRLIECRKVNGQKKHQIILHLGEFSTVERAVFEWKRELTQKQRLIQRFVARSEWFQWATQRYDVLDRIDQRGFSKVQDTAARQLMEIVEEKLPKWEEEHWKRVGELREDSLKLKKNIEIGERYLEITARAKDKGGTEI